MIVIGQVAARNMLRVLRNDRMSVLLTGRPGMGKTLLGQYYLSMFSSGLLGRRRYMRVDGGSTSTDRVARAMEDNTYVLVDEVHRISNLEALYPVLDATRPRGWFAKNSVYAFTTTDEGRLPPAFRSRLVLVSLEPYSQAELAAIAYHERRLPDEALFEVARLARGSPRRAKLLVRLCKSATSASQVRAMLRHVGYSGGLSSRERTLLNLLRDGPKSIATLASMMGTSHNTVKQLESDLIAAGLVQIDHRGRSLTSHGFGVTGGSQ